MSKAIVAWHANKVYIKAVRTYSSYLPAEERPMRSAQTIARRRQMYKSERFAASSVGYGNIQIETLQQV